MALEDKIKMQKKKEILEKHPYSIWKGTKNHYWYTYLPENGNLKLIKRKDKETLQNIIINFWWKKSENVSISLLCDEWLEKNKQTTI